MKNKTESKWVENQVKKIKNGDIQPLESFYKLFYNSLFSIAYFIMRDDNLAKDAAHEVFLNLPNKIHQLKDYSKIEAWLNRIVINEAYNILRQRAKCSHVADISELYNTHSMPSPESEVLEKEEAFFVRGLIRSMPRDLQQVIFYRYYQNLTIDEISELLVIPRGTVKSRLFRAREALEKIIKKYTKTR